MGCYHPEAATGVPCAANGDCPGDQVCDLSASPPTCGTSPGDARHAEDAELDAPAVACVDGSTCPAGSPICDPDAHVCRGCVADVECGAGACTEYDGLCIADADTIYLAPTGGDDSGTCTASAPCATPAAALQQVAGTRRTIRVGNGTYNANGASIATIGATDGRIVLSGEAAIATGATFTVTLFQDGMPMVQTAAGTDVVIEGLTISGSGSAGVRSAGALLLSDVTVTKNTGLGVVTTGGSLQLQRTRVVANTLGGIEATSTTVTAVSSVIANNGGGNGGGQVGGVTLLGVSTPEVFQFVTIANNSLKKGQNNVSPGIQADGKVTIESSIVSGNGAVAGGSMAPQLSTSCSATYTLFSDAAPSGTGNVVGAADFTDAATYGYHIAAQSAARGAGDPSSTVRYDIDGEPRPPGPAFDSGADEIP